MNKLKGRKFHRFGVATVGTTYSDLAPGGINFLQTADAVRVKAGGSANDDAAGTHAREILIEGLDQDWNLVRESITLAGASASASTTITFLRVFHARVEEVGAYGNTNENDIVIEDEAGTVDLVTIPAGAGHDRAGHITVPTGRTLSIRRVFSVVDPTKLATVRLWFRHNPVDPSSGPYYAAENHIYLPGVSNDLLLPHGFHSLGARTDIWLDAKVSAETSEMSAGFDGEMVIVQGGPKFYS